MRNVIVLNHSRHEWAVLPKDMPDPFMLVRLTPWDLRYDTIKCIDARHEWVDPANATRLHRSMSPQWNEIVLTPSHPLPPPPLPACVGVWIWVFTVLIGMGIGWMTGPRCVTN